MSANDGERRTPASAAETRNEPALWELREDVRHAACKVFDVRRRRFRHPRRKAERDFFVIDSRNWCNVLPLTPEGELVLVRQFRFGVRQLCWETPGGIMDGGEDPVSTAIRELAEETGYRGEKARVIGACNPNPAIMNNRCYYVRIDDCRLAGSIDWDENEEIEVATVPVSQAMEWARAGKISHAMAINALFYLQASLAAESCQ